MEEKNRKISIQKKNITIFENTILQLNLKPFTDYSKSFPNQVSFEKIKKKEKKKKKAKPRKLNNYHCFY